MSGALSLRDTNLDRYMAEISTYPLLTAEQEVEYARRFQESGDLTAAHQLVVSNLRFVVKVAHEYRGYGFKLLDLIQEGNVGLMVAVKRFDWRKGYRLISYAVWWIRAYIKSFVLRSWSMVKLGTTHAQRKLFFKLRSTQSRARAESSTPPSAEELADELGVSEDEVLDMESRLAARDFSLDARIGEDGATTHVDRLSNAEQSPEETLARREDVARLRSKVSDAMGTLNDKERYIVEHRLLSEEPQALQAIGDTFHVSRERVRQLEERVVKKLRNAFFAESAAAPQGS